MAELGICGADVGNRTRAFSLGSYFQHRTAIRECLVGVPPGAIGGTPETGVTNARNAVSRAKRAVPGS
jgi:hypothetical protein